MPNCAAMEGLALTQSASITPDSRALLPNPTASGRGGAPSWRSLPLCPMAEVGSAHQRLRDHLHQTRLLGSISSAYADLLAAAEAELDGGSAPEAVHNLQLLRLELRRQQVLDPGLVATTA
jgi:hypothetical protein